MISEASGLWCLDRVPMRHLNVHGDLVWHHMCLLLYADVPAAVYDYACLWCLHRVPMRHLNVHGDLGSLGYRPVVHSFSPIYP